MMELFGDPDNPEDTKIIPPQPNEQPISAIAQGQQTHDHMQTHPSHIEMQQVIIIHATREIMVTERGENPAAAPSAAMLAANGNGSLRKPPLRTADSFTGETAPPTETSSSTLGMRIFLAFSGFWAIVIVAGGIYMLSHDSDALLDKARQCDQLYVWSLLFVVFESVYLIFVLLHAFRYREANLHAKRAKTSFLFIVMLMSIMMFVVSEKREQHDGSMQEMQSESGS